MQVQLANTTAISDEVLTLQKRQRPVVPDGWEEDEQEPVEAVIEDELEVVVSLEELDSNVGKWKIVPGEMGGR